MFVVTQTGTDGSVTAVLEDESGTVALNLAAAVATVDNRWIATQPEELPPGVVAEWTQPGVPNLPTLRVIRT